MEETWSTANMIIPLNWLSDYLPLTKSPQEIADSFTTIGLLLDKPIEGKVLELEQRLNRADLLSIVGCARDLAAFEGIKLKEPKIPSHPLKLLAPTDKIKLNVKTPVVRRFNTRVFKGLKVAPSPKWLVDRLEAYGIESKNNIVDITNFVMVEYGQPLHAQDLRKLENHELTLREARAGEQITTLLGTKVKLDSGMFVISSGKTLCVIGGIVGGAKTGVTGSTTEIILDAGNYDQRHIRTNSRRLKLVNETVLRYDKYLDPRLAEVAIDRATDLILELAGGTVYENEDYYPNPVTANSLTLTYARLTAISGLVFKPSVVKSRLKLLGYTILYETKDSLELENPYWRTDLEVEDDLISDVLRIGNFNCIPTSSLTTSVPEDLTPTLYLFEDRLRDLLTALGAHEHITIPLISGDGHPNRVTLVNALSSDQNALRLTLTETLTPVLTTYHKHNLHTPLLFEIAKSFALINHKPAELRELAIVSTADLRPLVTALLTNLGINPTLKPDTHHAVKLYAGKDLLGTLTLTTCTLNTEALLKHASYYVPVITTHSHTTSLDLSLVLPKGMFFCEVEKTLRTTSKSLQSIEVLEHYAQKNSLLVRLTWHKLADPNKTRLSLIKALKEMGVVSRSG